MKKLLILLLVSVSAFAQISLNPLSKYIKRVEYVFDTLNVDTSHQILIICGNSVLINFPDTTMLNADWGTYQQAGYGYQPEDYQYNLDIRFNGVGTVFLSDSLYVRYKGSVYVTKELTSGHVHRWFRSVNNDRLWIQYIPHENKFFIYRKEEL
jgi:hypothetical protein